MCGLSTFICVAAHIINNIQDYYKKQKDGKTEDLADDMRRLRELVSCCDIILESSEIHIITTL